jgi:ABC-type transport system involved in cytochrome c biogenesis permease component
MNVAPVVERELGSAARAPFTYVARVLAVAAVLAVVFSSGVLEDGSAAAVGPRLFLMLHVTLLGSIWVLVPFMACDTISRERREGTLPLLSLTALDAADVAWAKAAAQGLRAFSVWLAVLPIMAIPLLLGGVAWPDFFWSVLVHFLSILIALGAGLAASACSKQITRAAGLGSFFAAIGFYYLTVLLPFSTFLGSFNPILPMRAWGGQDRPWFGMSLALNAGGAWQTINSQPGYLPVIGYVSALGFGVLSFIVVMRFVCRRVGWAWREEPPGPRLTRVSKLLFTPMFFKRFLAGWMRQQLRANPIGWLEQRTWSGRMVMWVWFAIVMSFYVTAFTESWLIYRAFQRVQVLMGWLLVGSIAASASGSFRRERETGVLELILVSPLSERSIIFGRLRGLWSQFFPAIAMLCGVWIYFKGLPITEVELWPMVMFLVMFLTVPVVGLHFSLASTNNIGAFVRTLFVIIVFPVGLANLLANLWGVYMTWPSHRDSLFVALMLGLQLVIGSLFALRLHARLKNRSFPFQNA